MDKIRKSIENKKPILVILILTSIILIGLILYNVVLEEIIEENGSKRATIMKNNEVAVGSYIKYKGGDYRGKWVVLRNDGENIEIISKDSVGLLTLHGVDGYANCVKILNDKCREYVNDKYALSGRSVGATADSIEQIDTEKYPITWAGADAIGEDLPYEDKTYISDRDIIRNNSELNHGTTNTRYNNGGVWLASRHLFLVSVGSSFSVRLLEKNGVIGDAGLVSAGPDGSVGVGGPEWPNGVRPVITLKSEIRIVGGTGTARDPYQISI